MQDDQLLADLEAMGPLADSTVDALRRNGITTYSQLFALVRDDGADSELRGSACWALSWLGDVIDKRRAVPPLLAALKTSDEQVRWHAAHSLGTLGARRAVAPLMELVADKSQPAWVRARLIDSLCSIDSWRRIYNPRIPEFLRPIMFDQTEPVVVRSSAIEWLFDRDHTRWLPVWIDLLGDPASDVRFWAAYRLSQYWGNLTAALGELDRIVAYDHTVPEDWGWHVGREAIHALEDAYMQVWGGYPEDDADFCGSRYYPWLISPAPEYETFIAQCRTRLDDWTYTTREPDPVTLDIDPDWLAGRLRERWPEVELNTRQPRPQAYVLDWRMIVADRILSGALHRDRYAVVVTGDEAAVRGFARWYRGVVGAEQALYLYEWAMAGEEIASND